MVMRIPLIQIPPMGIGHMVILLMLTTVQAGNLRSLLNNRSLHCRCFIPVVLFDFTDTHLKSQSTNFIKSKQLTYVLYLLEC